MRVRLSCFQRFAVFKSVLPCQIRSVFGRLFIRSLKQCEREDVVGYFRAGHLISHHFAELFAAVLIFFICYIVRAPIAVAHGKTHPFIRVGILKFAVFGIICARTFQFLIVKSGIGDERIPFFIAYEIEILLAAEVIERVLQIRKICGTIPAGDA